MLDAHQLNVFLVAAETLNFTETAKRLHMTQPSVSQHIKAIEKNFGCKLFVRNGRHLELTDAGNTLLPLAREMVNQSILIQETMESLKGEVYGHLLVGCSTTPGKYVLPNLLARFHEQYPQVSISCDVTNQEIALERLCSGQVHIILTNRSQEECKDARIRHFVDDPLVLIVPSHHPWAKVGQIEPDQLLDELFILRETNSGTYRAVNEALKLLGYSIEDLDTLLTLGNSEAIALGVQEGLGVGFVSNLVVNKLNLEGIKPVKIKGVDMLQRIYMGYQTKRPASAAQVAFWKFAQSIRDKELLELRENSKFEYT